MMKNTTILILCLLIAPFLLNAQIGERRRIKERVEAQRVAFMTRQLDLTPEESAAFWPLYNQYRKEQENLRKQLNVKEEEVAIMSDNEVNQLLDKMIEMEYQQIEIRKSLLNKLKTVLPPRKILMIDPIEKAFNREILKKIRGLGTP